MAEKVPMIDMGRAKLGIMVADKLRRKRKMTITTRQMVRNKVNWTSLTDSRMDKERSKRMFKLTEPGI